MRKNEWPIDENSWCLEDITNLEEQDLDEVIWFVKKIAAIIFFLQQIPQFHDLGVELSDELYPGRDKADVLDSVRSAQRTMEGLELVALMANSYLYRHKESLKKTTKKGR